MIQSAVADIIGPAVAAKDPDGFLCELVLVLRTLATISETAVPL